MNHKTLNEEIASRTEYMEPDGKQINSSLSTALKFRPNESFKVDFIAGKDKDTLDKWRRSKDKRRWEVAVSILESRSMSSGRDFKQNREARQADSGMDTCLQLLWNGGPVAGHHKKKQK